MIGRRSSGRRTLATVLFTDIVGSTERAEALGDRSWRDLLGRHHRVVRRQLGAHRGREIDTAGDGFLATFAGPDEAIACAMAIVRGIESLGMQIRAGIHTGEVEPMGKSIGGIAVHLAARIQAAAEPGQIVVSSTVRDLASGSNYTFTDLGTRQLKGISGESHIFAVEPRVAEPEALDQTADAPTGIPTMRFAAAGIAFAFGLMAVVGAVAVALLTRDSGGTGGPEGPNFVQALDGSGQPGVGFDIGLGPSAVIVADGALWVANTQGGTVSRVDPEEGQTAVVGVGVPVDLAASGGLIWVLDPFGSSLVIVSPSDARVIGSVPVHGRAIAATADAVWLADDITDTVHRIDPRSRLEVATIALPTGSQPTSITADESAVWVANGGTSTVSRIDPATNEVTVDAIGLSERPTSMAMAGNKVWVLAESADLLIRIDAATNRVAQEMEVCDGPASLSADGDRVWVACAGGGTVSRIEAGSSEPANTDVDGVPSDLVVDGGTVWVTIRES